MITDYEPFLRVMEDGHIWWLLKDAIRLGAGFLPMRDDHQVMETELRVPNNRAFFTSPRERGSLKRIQKVSGSCRNILNGRKEYSFVDFRRVVETAHFSHKLQCSVVNLPVGRGRNQVEQWFYISTHRQPPFALMQVGLNYASGKPDGSILEISGFRSSAPGSARVSMPSDACGQNPL